MKTTTQNKTIVAVLGELFGRFCKAPESSKSTAGQTKHKIAAWNALTDDERERWEDLACFVVHPSEQLQRALNRGQDIKKTP